MKKQTFDALLESLDLAVAIEAGEAPAPVERVYQGSVLVEVRNDGETVWRLADARPEPAVVFAVDGPDVAALRKQLHQTQPGLAELLGVPVGTVRNWEQKRRGVEGAALTVIRVAVARPDVLLSALPAAA